jgi:hypothetical protein
MQNLVRGMELGVDMIFPAIIGQQGTPTAPSDNQWNGLWPTGTFGAYVNNSDATFSPLYIEPLNGTAYSVPNFGANVPFSQEYANPLNRPAATGAYVCGGGYNQRIIGLTDSYMDGWNVTLSPNPASKQVVIKSTNISEALTVKAFDLGGRCVFKNSLTISNNTCTLHLDVENGVYLLSIDNGQATPQLIKLVVVGD